MNKTLRISPTLLKNWKTISNRQVNEIKKKLKEFLLQEDSTNITTQTQLRVSIEYHQNYTLIIIITSQSIYQSKIIEKINKTMGITNTIPEIKYLVKIIHPQHFSNQQYDNHQPNQHPIVTRLEKYQVKKIRGETLGKYFVKRQNEKLPIQLNHYDEKTMTYLEHGKLCYYKERFGLILPNQPNQTKPNQTKPNQTKPNPLNWIYKFQDSRDPSKIHDILEEWKWNTRKFTNTTWFEGEMDGEDKPTILSESTFLLHNPPVSIPELMINHPDQTDQWYRVINIIVDDYYYWDVKFFLINPHTKKVFDLNVYDHMYAFDCQFHSFWIENNQELKGFRYSGGMIGKTKEILYHRPDLDSQYSEQLNMDQYCHEFQEEIGELTLCKNLDQRFSLEYFLQLNHQANLT